MKQTLTINLSGIVFHMDNDAYDKLQDYMQQVEQRLGSTPETNEIMQDIEARIAELFTDMLVQKRTEVVDMEMTERIMAQLGSPEAFGDADDIVEMETGKVRESSRRRFYRDVDNQIIGGVCAGMAAYLGWDSFWVRVLVLVCTCFWGITVPVYLVMWLIAPAAQTAAQRLEMRGEIASVDNIKKEYERAKDYAVQHGFSHGCRRVFVILCKLFVGFLLLCIGVPLVAVLVVLCMGLLGALLGLLGGFGGLFAGLPFVDVMGTFWGNGWFVALALLFVVQLIGIPLFAVVYWIIKYARQRKHPSAAFWWITGVLWIVSLVGTGAMAVWGVHSVAFAEALFAEPLETTAETRDMEDFHSVAVTGAVCLTVRQDTACLLTIKTENSSAITTEVRDGVLYVECLAGIPGSMEVMVSLPELRSVTLSGVGRFETDGLVSGKDLAFRLNGASDMDVQLDVEHLVVDVQGASRLDMKGKAGLLDLRLAGAGSVDAFKLLTDTAVIWCAGGSKADVSCAQSLDAQAYGASRIRYKGNPVVERELAVGASRIKRK